MAKFGICFGYILLVLMQNIVAPNPLLNRYNDQELDSLKDLIHRLEEKLTSNDEPEVYPGYEDAKVDAEEEAVDISPSALRQGEDSVLMNTPDRALPDSAARSRFRDLAGLTRTAKSFNSCFGNRIERIGSWSGLGCNSIKTGTKKRIFGN
ncbi:ventricular natriuretic peptide-like [Megalops cyprinoides]|uniref:ventricular natriuretic peptide-like n=1 Tax=Megalops cyprinoides TaxID=118141 RepID=UPI0018646D1F|nr:ventricular natriuretic peptide-like [Megalops cyprinoides]